MCIRDSFSVVPMDAVLEGVTIENAKYELTNGTVTVSYTHLDVYKRQLLGTGHYPQETRNPVQESGRNPDFAGDSGENPCKLCTVCKDCLLYTSRCV